MEKENKVSVWAGKFSNVVAFQVCITEFYDEEGEMRSPFTTDFGIDFYDIDLEESFFNTAKMMCKFL